MAENCKISDITKCGKKMTTIAKNVKKCQQIYKNENIMVNLIYFYFHRFSVSKIPQKWY